jgi:hypothetical protein
LVLELQREHHHLLVVMGQTLSFHLSQQLAVVEVVVAVLLMAYLAALAVAGEGLAQVLQERLVKDLLEQQEAQTGQHILLEAVEAVLVL